MYELETQIGTIDEAAMDALFDETPNKTVSADTILGGKAPVVEATEDEDDEEEVKPVKKARKEKQVATPQLPTDTIETVNFDEEDTTDDEDEEDEDEEVVDEKKKPARSKKEEKVEEAKVANPEVHGILKSTVDYLVEQGLWSDFDGREDMEFTEESYAELAAEQDKVRVHGMFEELVDSTGAYGKAIINFVKNGGNPDEIIDLFKEQKAVEAINIESLDGQKTLVKQYYTEVMGWKPEKAEKLIAKLVVDGELEDEAGEVKDLYGNFYQKEAQRLNKAQEEALEAQRDREMAFENNMRTAIKDRKDLDTRERRVIEDYLLNYDQKLPNGQLVNKFYVNFAKMQANPQDYVDLVMFVMDKERFVKKIAKQEETKAAANSFKFIKGNGAVSTKKGTSYDSIRKEKQQGDFDWGLPKR